MVSPANDNSVNMNRVQLDERANGKMAVLPAYTKSGLHSCLPKKKSELYGGAVKLVVFRHCSMPPKTPLLLGVI
jgi:hypothetical protein